MVRTAVCSVKNGRQYMEDRYSICKNLTPNLHMFAVYDGHGGQQVADTCATHFPDILRSYLHDNTNKRGTHPPTLPTSKRPAAHPRSHSHSHSHPPFSPGTALRRSLKDADIVAWKAAQSGEDVVAGTQCGSTACIAVLEPHKLTVANVGDSRAIMKMTSGAIRSLSEDHKPGCPKETIRVEEAGGYVANVMGVDRVMGMLSLSRAMGDWYARPYISQQPDISRIDLRGDEDYLLIASDGLWDVLSNQDAIDVIDRVREGRRKLAVAAASAASSIASSEDNASQQSKISREKLLRVRGPSVARALVDEAIRRKSTDNITVIWVDLGPNSMLIDTFSTAQTVTSPPNPAALGIASRHEVVDN